MAPSHAPAPPAPAGTEPVPRQFVNFAFYRVDPAWRRLPEKERQAGKREFAAVCEEYSRHLILRPFTMQGLRADADLMLWRIGEDLPKMSEMSARLLATGLGQWLTVPYNYMALTKRSAYVDKIDPGHPADRLRVVPAERQYLFVYPFLKTRAWYLLTPAARQGMMDEHIEIGNRYKSVKLNTTYSFGLDDQEFVVAFETDKPSDFLDLVMDLRHTEVSRYTLRDTPIFFCMKLPMAEVLDRLGG